MNVCTCACVCVCLYIFAKIIDIKLLSNAFEYYEWGGEGEYLCYAVILISILFTEREFLIGDKHCDNYPQ